MFLLISQGPYFLAGLVIGLILARKVINRRNDE